MQILQRDQVKGQQVPMVTKHARHYKTEKKMQSPDNVERSFADMFKSAFNKVNSLQVNADELTRKMVVSPEKVSVHSVMIASQKAELALSMTKAVTDRVVRAYRNITTLR